MSVPSAARELRRTPRVLSIAGSDSGGGAGIQADLKAFARCGVHGMTAVTAITAQNTVGVSVVHPLPGEIVLAQVRAVLADIGADAVKVGMLGSREVILAVATALRELPAGTPVVVDPVMVAESGASLLQTDAEQALVEQILPLAGVITPNLPEARALARWVQPGERRACGEEDEHEDEQLARALLALGPGAVVLTGGHRSSSSDLLCVPCREVIRIPGERFPDGAAHGSGCTHSSVLAAQLAIGVGLSEAARIARDLAGQAVRDGLRDIGAGVGPVDVLGIRRRSRCHGEPRGADCGARR